MGNDGFDDDFYKIFKKYKLDFMDELNLREEVQSYTKKRFVSKDKIEKTIKEIENRIEKNYKDYDKSIDVDLKQAIHRRLNTNIQIRDVLKELLEE